ncbi:50S ribosomal protein L5 [Candidatus Woesearchaeota archaeon]|nr:50S ribosomal protein L5 [Candidatus Woesearchaeota archaeon]
MKKIRIEKLTLNIGSGKSQETLEKGMKLLKNITGLTPVKTTSTKRIPNWGLRPGLQIGCKITVRKAPAKELISRLLQAKDNKLSQSQFDSQGNVSFGIHEYIDIPGIKYDPEIGVMGLQASITLERIGFRIKRRKLQKRTISAKHQISKDEAIEFIKNEFETQIGEEE